VPGPGVFNKAGLNPGKRKQSVLYYLLPADFLVFTDIQSTSR